jgi:hypothetical protein
MIAPKNMWIAKLDKLRIEFRQLISINEKKLQMQLKQSKMWQLNKGENS